MEQLLQLLSGIRPDVDFSKETTLIDDGILGSFDIVSIVNELNDAYGSDISVADIDPENFNSAEAILALVESAKAE